MAKAYPHLLPDDRKLWERFLASPHNIYTDFDYDVQVGLGRDPGEEFEEPYRSMGHQLSMRRIDVVAYTPSSITVIEVSVDAGLTQIGQLHAYPCWYRETYQPKRPVFPLLVAENLQTDIETALKAQKLAYIVLEKGN